MVSDTLGATESIFVICMIHTVVCNPFLESRGNKFSFGMSLNFPFKTTFLHPICRVTNIYKQLTWPQEVHVKANPGPRMQSFLPLPQ